MSQDMHKVASKYSKVLLDNDNVRVVELNWKKGLKIEKHSHPKYFAYAITPLKYKSTSPDGKTQTRSMKKGEITWYDAESHSVESTGTTGRALIVELKN
jgi:quercetin dioxygenase-like cupin family protein